MVEKNLKHSRKPKGEEMNARGQQQKSNLRSLHTCKISITN